MAAILIEDLMIEAFKAAGIKAAIEESEDWSSSYVLISRNGGEDDPYVDSDRETVEMGISVFSTTRSGALNLGYAAKKICRDLPRTYSMVSRPLLDNLAEEPIFNGQYAYTFGVSYTVNQANTQ